MWPAGSAASTLQPARLAITPPSFIVMTQVSGNLDQHSAPFGPSDTNRRPCPSSLWRRAQYVLTHTYLHSSTVVLALLAILLVLEVVRS